jgi:hypothetical protein
MGLLAPVNAAVIVSGGLDAPRLVNHPVCGSRLFCALKPPDEKG